jgi:hypothetical protein
VESSEDSDDARPRALASAASVRHLGFEIGDRMLA